MKLFIGSVCLCSALFAALTVAPLCASDLYVAPSGTSSGSGTLSQPLDLRTALSGQAGRPGDTFWLRGGNYALGHLDTTIHGASGQPITFRQMPGERARVDGSLTFFESIGYVVLRDFELYSSDTNRVSSQTGVGYKPTDIRPIDGVGLYAPNMSFINLIVHDHVRSGFYVAQWATNTLIYGCMVYNNGWVSPDNSSGCCFYLQSSNGWNQVSDNVAFNTAGAGLQVYDDAANARLAGVTIDGNVLFGAGALSTVRTYRDWIIGVDSPGLSATAITLRDNMGYWRPGSSTLTQVQIGRQGINGSVVVSGNYFPQGLVMNNWQSITFTNNTLSLVTNDYIVDLQQTLTSGLATWNNNSYKRPPTGKDFHRNSTAYSFSGWENATGYDAASTYGTGALTGTKVFVRTNRYEAGRAHIIVYNWDNLTNVSVDVRSVLPVGTSYEVRNALDFFAAPVLSGTYAGEALQLPMRGLTVARPNGKLPTPPTTGPTFNVFELLPRSLSSNSSLVPPTNLRVVP